MAIEIIPKPKIKEIPWSDIILTTCLIIFLLCFLSYFVLVYFQTKFQQELSKLENALVRTSSEKKLEEETLGYKRKIEDFGFLLENHRFPLNIFNFLEKNTHPKVWFSKLNLDLEKNLLTVSGQADNSEVMGQQILIFKKEALIQNLNLSNLSRGKEGKIEFDLQFTFQPQIFK